MTGRSYSKASECNWRQIPEFPILLHKAERGENLRWKLTQVGDLIWPWTPAYPFPSLREVASLWPPYLRASGKSGPLLVGQQEQSLPKGTGCSIQTKGVCVPGGLEYSLRDGSLCWWKPRFKNAPGLISSLHLCQPYVSFLPLFCIKLIFLDNSFILCAGFVPTEKLILDF